MTEQDVLPPAQRRVLEWLIAYPGVHLGGGGAEYPHWTAMWANEAARQDMVSVVGQLGMDASASRPKTLQFLNEATPRCGRRIFASLLRAGYLRKLSAHRVIPFYGYWTISANGRAAVEHDRALGIDVEPAAERPEQVCACGMVTRSVGGHRRSQRHCAWLALEAYRAAITAQNAALAANS